MKKLGIIVMAVALLMGMSQCKKENTAASNDEGFKVPITLNVSGNSGSRVAVEGSTGVVTFENGDVIHVVSNGVYVGTMTYNGTVFSGEVTEPTEGQKLQFYFLGNKTPEFNADNTSCSVIISDQTEYLPVISYAPSRENYQVGKTDYNATLLNKCALVKFDVTTASEAATCIVGMNNKVMVDFSSNGFTYGQEGDGIITLATGNGEKWAILLPQEEAVNVEARSFDGIYSGDCGTIQSIAENDYLTEGIDITLTLPVGAINGLFTINADGDQVYFSKGNLQYTKSTQMWSFMMQQFDMVEMASQDVGDSYDDQDVISLFGWSTSGYDHGAVAYQPWSTSNNDNDYWAYGYWQNNLNSQNGQADWGYNVITNGGNTENSGWHMLSQNEWKYVFRSRSTSSGIRWAKGTVNGIGGIILLPDSWTASFYSLNNTNGGDYDSNIIAANDWIDMLEVNGAVFLPAAGFRNGTSVSGSVGSTGYYWSSSYRSNIASGRVYFKTDNVNLDYMVNRCVGASVRLVRNAE